MRYDPEEVRRLIHGSSGVADKHWRDGMISARELCAMRFAPLKFIVPKIIPEGLTILAGRPKIGKSWLVLLLGVVLANGVAALGLDYGMTTPLKGSVLYLGLEDGKRRLQRRMTKLVGIRPEHWPEQLYLKTDWRRFDQGGLDDIRAWYSEAKAKGETPVLIVVDTYLEKSRL
jgi:RecA-family ATPase